MVLKIFLFILIIPIIIYSQNLSEVFPIANDSTINEVNPYLTTYWYDGWNNSGNIMSVKENNSPLWLTYIETDSSTSYKVVAYNFYFDYNHSISCSPKHIIANSLDGTKKSNPIIENYLGKPIAIWSETNFPQADLYYSTLSDSSWSEAKKITDDLEEEKNVRFITIDSWQLSEQNSSFNYLVWNSNKSVISSKLTSELIWSKKDTIYQANNKITDIDIRNCSNGDVWLVLSEKLNSDSSVVEAFIQLKDSAEWRGPFLVKKIKGTLPQCEINNISDWENSGMVLFSWVENDSSKGCNIYFKNDTLVIESGGIENLQFPEGTFYTSNSLLSGGCVIETTPYYFTSTPTDTSNIFNIHSYYYYHQNGIGETKNTVNGLTISGVNRSHFIVGWSENKGKQSDIYLIFNYISMGDVDDEIIPNKTVLEQNYPNPFNPSTTISYTIPVNVKGEKSNVKLVIYDVLGREVATLVNKRQSTGSYEVVYDASELNSGVYFYQLQSGNFTESKKMILLK